MSEEKTELGVTKKAHPEYERLAPYWDDCYYLCTLGDSKTVKDQTIKYLPKLQSQIRQNAQQGNTEYLEYLSNAVWSEIPKEAVSNILGEMFVKPTTLKLPKVFDDYISDITSDGNGLNILEALITIAQLEYSRIGLMAYVTDDLTATKLPKIATYNALDIFKWNQVRNPKTGDMVYDLVELRSQGYEMDPETLEYKQVTKYHIHAISPEGNYYKVTLSENEYEKYRKGGYSKRATHPTYIEPVFRGFNLNYVPFVAINASNVDGVLDIPVLYAMMTLAIHAYKNSALYGKKLKIQTWALLALAGYSLADIDQGVKADGVLPSTDPNAKAEYITPSSDSLNSLKEAWLDMLDMAKSKGVQISEKTQVESGIALEKRLKNQSNAFRKLAEIRNEGILKILSYISDWGSMKVKITNDMMKPYIDFNISGASVEDLTKMGLNYKSGIVTLQDLYDFQRKNGFTNYETLLDFQSELENSNFQG